MLTLLINKNWSFPLMPINPAHIHEKKMNNTADVITCCNSNDMVKADLLLDFFPDLMRFFTISMIDNNHIMYAEDMKRSKPQIAHLHSSGAINSDTPSKDKRELMVRNTADAIIKIVDLGKIMQVSNKT